MFAYHVDKSEFLQVGDNLIPNKQANGHYSDISNSRYKDGYSPWGQKVLNLGDVNLLDVINGKPHYNTYMIEILYEYERLASFPDRPSRLQSIFASSNIEQAKKWRTVIGNDSLPIYRIEFNEENSAELDSTLLKLQLKKFSLPVLQDNAQKYWGLQRSDTPNLEVLISGPIKIVERV